MSIEQDCRETVVFALMKAKDWTKPQAEEYVSLWLDHHPAIQQAEAKQPATGEPVAWSEREQLRHAQAAVVMPMIGPLLDAWENSDREVMSQEPELSKQLKNINSAMEDADTHPAPSAAVTPEPVGHYTGRCAHCGSSNLWDDNLAYGCIPADGPSTYEQRFTDAVRAICGVTPPAELVSYWISNTERDDDLQQWVGSYAPGWVQNIAVLDAAHVMATQPTEGGAHRTE